MSEPLCVSDCDGSLFTGLMESKSVSFSINRFTNINVGWAGSVNDARVLRNSPLFNQAESEKLFPPVRHNLVKFYRCYTFVCTCPLH